MRQIASMRLFSSFFKILLPGVLFLFLVALFDNKSILTMTIQTDSGQAADPVIYYTQKGVAFNEENRCRGWKKEGSLYSFSLPSFNRIDFARLDPVHRREKIRIGKQAFLTTTHWFKTYYYEIDMTKSVPGNEISAFTITPQGVSFTAGRHSFLNLNLTRKHISKTHNYHLDTLLIALSVYLMLLFLYKYYRKDLTDNRLTAKIILYGLFIAFALFKANYYKSHIHHTYPPDTIAHLSYIQSVHEHTTLLPKFENMYMITNPNAGNYLSHPPLYYMLMNTVFDPTIPFMENMDRFRSLNIALFFAGIILLAYLGLQMEMHILGDFVYLSLLTSLPIHAYLGSSINNDNLAILGGFVFLIGLFKLIKRQYTTKTYLILAIGIFLAYFGKLTAAMLVFFALLYYFIYLFRKKIPLRIPGIGIVILSLFLFPILIYQLYIFLHYHAIVPTLKVTHPQEYLHSVYFVPPEQRVSMNFAAWIKHYWNTIQTGWFGILSHHSFAKTSLYLITGSAVLHFFAIFGLFLPCKEQRSHACLLGKIALLSLFTVMIIQILFSYINFLHSGYMGGLQPRYLLPFMVAFAIMASVFIDRFKENFFAVILTVLLCIQAIYSDFFYFLTYYL